MRCETAREHFSDLVEGNVDHALKLAIEHHCQGCPACSDEYGGFRQTWQTLDTIPWAEPSPEVRARVMAALRKQVSAEPVAAPSRWSSWWQSIVRPVPVNRALGWSVAVLALVAIAIPTIPTNVVRWIVAPNITVGENALKSVQVQPVLTAGEDSRTWQLLITGGSQPVHVTIYTLATDAPRKNWGPWMVSSLAPTDGLTVLKSQMILDGSGVVGPLTVRKTGQRGVCPVVLQLAGGGHQRYVAVWLPLSPGLPAVRSSAQGSDVLASAVHQIVNDYQVPVVQDASIDATVEVGRGSTANEALEQVARQIPMKMEALDGGAFRLTSGF